MFYVSLKNILSHNGRLKNYQFKHKTLQRKYMFRLGHDKTDLYFYKRARLLAGFFLHIFFQDTSSAKSFKYWLSCSNCTLAKFSILCYYKSGDMAEILNYMYAFFMCKVVFEFY